MANASPRNQLDNQVSVTPGKSASNSSVPPPPPSVSPSESPHAPPPLPPPLPPIMPAGPPTTRGPPVGPPGLWAGNNIPGGAPGAPLGGPPSSGNGRAPTENGTFNLKGINKRNAAPGIGSNSQWAGSSNQWDNKSHNSENPGNQWGNSGNENPGNQWGNSGNENSSNNWGASGLGDNSNKQWGNNSGGNSSWSNNAQNSSGHWNAPPQGLNSGGHGGSTGVPNQWNQPPRSEWNDIGSNQWNNNTNSYAYAAPNHAAGNNMMYGAVKGGNANACGDKGYSSDGKGGKSWNQQPPQQSWGRDSYTPSYSGKDSSHGGGKDSSYGGTKGYQDQRPSDQYNRGAGDYNQGADLWGDGYNNKGNDQYGKGPNDQYPPKGDNQWANKGGSDSSKGDNPWTNNSYGNKSNDQYGKGPNDQYGKGSNDQHAKGPNDQYAKGPNDQYAKGPNDQYGKGSSDQYAKGSYDVSSWDGNQGNQSYGKDYGKDNSYAIAYGGKYNSYGDGYLNGGPMGKSLPSDNPWENKGGGNEYSNGGKNDYFNGGKNDYSGKGSGSDYKGPSTDYNTGKGSSSDYNAGGKGDYNPQQQGKGLSSASWRSPGAGPDHETNWRNSDQESSWRAAEQNSYVGSDNNNERSLGGKGKKSGSRRISETDSTPSSNNMYDNTNKGGVTGMDVAPGMNAPPPGIMGGAQPPPGIMGGAPPPPGIMGGAPPPPGIMGGAPGGGNDNNMVPPQQQNGYSGGNNSYDSMIGGKSSGNDTPMGGKSGKKQVVGSDGRKRNVIKGDALNSMRNKGADGFDAQGNCIGKGEGTTIPPATGFPASGTSSMGGIKKGGGKKGKKPWDPDREEAKKIDAKIVAAIMARADISTDMLAGVESSAQLEARQEYQAQLEASRQEESQHQSSVTGYQSSATGHLSSFGTGLSQSSAGFALDGISAMLNNPDLPDVVPNNSTSTGTSNGDGPHYSNNGYCGHDGEASGVTCKDVDERSPRQVSGGQQSASRREPANSTIGNNTLSTTSSPGRKSSGGGVEDLDLDYIENEYDKKYIQNLEYSLTGPLDADNLDRYPRIENWLLSQKQLGVSFKYTREEDGIQLIALLQFASMGTNIGENPKVLLLRTHANSESGVMLPESVLQVLTDKHIIKSVVGGAGDQSRIQRSFGIGIAGIKDPSELAKEYETLGKLPNGNVVQMSLRDLCNKFDFPFIRDRRIANSDWEKPNLSPAQIRTAADDAWFSLKCYLKLEDERRNKHTQIKTAEWNRWNERKGRGKN